MRRLNCYRIRFMLIGFVAAIVLVDGSARANFTFSEPVSLRTNVNSI
jgi:hypothetical protein